MDAELKQAMENLEQQRAEQQEETPEVPPVFSTTTTYTEQLYMGFSKYIQKNISTMGWWKTMICIMFGLIALVGLFSKDWLMAGAAAAAALFFWFYMEKSLDSQIKKMYQKSSQTHAMDSTYHFYEDHYSVDLGAAGKVNVLYENMYEIHEAKDAFYLLTAKNQGMIVDKANISSEEADFIRNIKVPEKPVEPIIQREFFKKKK